MTEHLGGPENAEQLAWRHERYVALANSGKGCMFVIVVGSEAAGSIGYWDNASQDQTVYEIGWSVLPTFQGKGIAKQATLLALDHARADGKHRYVHAFPAVANAPSNGICRSVGFTLLGDEEFEYPKGHFMRCNEWQFDLS